MQSVLIVDDRGEFRQAVADQLKAKGHDVLCVFNINEARELDNAIREDIALVVMVRRVERSDAAVKQVRLSFPMAHLVTLGGSTQVREALDAVRHVLNPNRHFSAERVAFNNSRDASLDRDGGETDMYSATPRYAVARWARAVAPIVHSSADTRTVAVWSRLIFVSPGALRNWCRTAGISPRRSLVLGRLLRAAANNTDGKQHVENLLDVVDRRTIVAMLAWAGIDHRGQFPTDLRELLRQQTLVRDKYALAALRATLATSSRCWWFPGNSIE